jgi:ubiquinone/menaquinone biosynthesis C-methylase UbiE
MSLSPAETYDEFIVPAIFRPWAAKVLGAHPPPPGCRVLDLACGTGVVARTAATLVGHGGRVDGIDVDAGMLAVARRRSPREQEALLAWCQASAQALPFGAAAFDVVVCFEGLQFFPDRPAALGEVRRVLRVGGRFVGTVWAALEHNPAYEAIAAALREHVSEGRRAWPHSP